MAVAPTTEITFDLYGKLCGISGKFKELWEKGKAEDPIGTYGENPGYETAAYDNPAYDAPVYEAPQISKASAQPVSGAKFCGQCGAKNESGAGFCGSCGAKL